MGKLTPLEAQRQAQAEIGYGSIHLLYDDGCASVRIEHAGRSVEVIRAHIGPIDGTFDHLITPIGIKEAIKQGGPRVRPWKPSKRRRPFKNPTRPPGWQEPPVSPGGQIIYVKTYGGACQPVEVDANGNMREWPYNWKSAVLCDDPTHNHSHS